MAVLTNLASTLTARYFPSKTLTDAFYLDGRLFGKREARQADITIEKNERGYFLSVFAHPKLPNYEPGLMPPYEPELRGTCNEVKFGHKEIDEMIEGFLTTAVDVTGKARITEEDDRSPYFSGVIVRDSEAFAVTIGTGLAFLYRDDVLYPLTDAGIPMEPIDAKGNRVSDFLYFCSSKTANALWSNFFTLAQDDCIILCNKEIYDALGQREILRILYEADDQCDAAGVIITQASARMPDVPMQFAISFVEDVVSDEKRGLFGFRKKNREEDSSDMSIKSTLDGGLVGAAANAAAAAGFAGGISIDSYKPQGDGNFVVFGDNKDSVLPPSSNQQASRDKGIELDDQPKGGDSEFVQFLDPSINKDVAEVSAEDVMKTLFADSVKEIEDKKEQDPKPSDSSAFVSEPSAGGSFFVNEGVNPFVAAAAPSPVAPVPTVPVAAPVPAAPSAPAPAAPVMQPISTTPVAFDASADDDKTKPIERLDDDLLAKLEKEGKQRNAEVSRAVKISSEEPLKPEAAPVVISSDNPFVINPDSSSISEDIKEEKNSDNVNARTDLAGLFVASPTVSSEDKTEPVPVPEEPVKGTFVFTPDEDNTPVPEITAPSTSSDFDPYNMGSDDEMKNAKAPVFGDDGSAKAPTDEEIKEAADGIPVPEFNIVGDEPSLDKSDMLGVEFPVNKEDKDTGKINEEQAPKEEITREGDISIPFENEVQTIDDTPKAVEEPIPEMPLYDANVYQDPNTAVNSDVPVQRVEENAYSYAQEPEVSAEEYKAYNPTSYEPYDEQPYQEGGYGYTPGQYQEGYNPADAKPAAADTGSDDAWINSILGIDDSAFDLASGVDEGRTADYASAGGVTMADNTGLSSRTAGQRMPPRQTPRNNPSSASRQRTQASGNGGGRRRVPRLNRNGYMFLAFVIVCIVCLIILISAIVRSCGKKEAEVTDTTESTPVAEMTIPEETETAATTTQDPSYPIGRFEFSEYIGYRTWWDIFNTVYGISDIANTSDPRIQIILDYNGLSADYTPSIGDQLLLPPVGVLDGTIPVTFRAGAASTADTTAGSLSGEVQTVSGTDQTEAEEQAGEAGEGAAA